MSAEPDRPPRSMRFKERAWTKVDWALAVICAFIVYATMAKGQAFNHSSVSLWPAGSWAPPLLALLMAAPVALRRRDPVGAFLLALVSGVLILSAGGQISRGAFLPLAFVLFTVAATRSRTVAVVSLAASMALLVIQGFILSMTGTGSGPATGVALILIIAWITGISAQQRRAYTARMREQVATAAVTEERLRIARELHDVVAHSMTVVAVQAGFGEYVFDSEPAQARAALGNIQHVTREALSDMQRLLGVLRQDSTGQPDAAGSDGQPEKGRPTAPALQLQLAPAPGLADLERLVSTTAGAGVRVDLIRTGTGRDIPAAIDQAAFRIVQEALTNVVKHSGASTCQVIIGYELDGLTVEITDPGGDGRDSREPGGARPNGTGHGILGMRERVSLCGGEFTVGPRPGHGFEVIAHFPLAAPPRAQRAHTTETTIAPAPAIPADTVRADTVQADTVRADAVQALPGQAR